MHRAWLVIVLRVVAPGLAGAADEKAPDLAAIKSLVRSGWFLDLMPAALRLS